MLNLKWMFDGKRLNRGIRKYLESKTYSEQLSSYLSEEIKGTGWLFYNYVCGPQSPSLGHIEISTGI